MNKKVLFLLLILALITANTYANRNSQNQIDNGWYSATVKYYNNNTYTSSTYKLDVKVEYNRVTAIDFGDGGSVHSGFNNSGYTYSGGTLYFEKDYNGNIIAANTKVYITEQNGTMITYEVRIE